MRNSPVTRDELDVLQRTIEDLRRDVLLLKNQHSPTVPVYLPDVPDDQIDGQIALIPVGDTLDASAATVKPAWSFGGLWRGLAGILFDIANVGGSLDVTTTANISLAAQTDYFSAADNGNYIVKVGTQDGADYSFQIVDASNAAVLKVKWNSGTSSWQYHGKTGAAWVFDL